MGKSGLGNRSLFLARPSCESSRRTARTIAGRLRIFEGSGEQPKLDDSGDRREWAQPGDDGSEHPDMNFKGKSVTTAACLRVAATKSGYRCLVGGNPAFQFLGPAEHDVEPGDGLVWRALHPTHNELPVGGHVITAERSCRGGGPFEEQVWRAGFEVTGSRERRLPSDLQQGP